MGDRFCDAPFFLAFFIKLWYDSEENLRPRLLEKKMDGKKKEILD